MVKKFRKNLENDDDIYGWLQTPLCSLTYTTNVLVPFDAVGLKEEASVLCLCSSKVLLLKYCDKYFFMKQNLVFWLVLTDHGQFTIHGMLVIFITILTILGNIQFRLIKE